MKMLLGRALAASEMSELTGISPACEMRHASGREEVLGSIGDVEVYVPGPWGEDLFEAGRKLKWVHFLWAGVDRALFPAIVDSEVTITNSAGAFGEPMAESAIALMLAFARGLNVAMRRAPDWRGARSDLWSMVSELTGATLGIIGYGGIGQATARRAKALGMRVVATRRHPDKSDGVADCVWTPDRLHDLLAESDYVLLSCPLTEETRGLIGARELGLMKPRAVLINLARGAVLDHAALTDALAAGRIGGAGLDVTSPEPLPEDSPLWRMENVIVTPHVSGGSPRVWEYQFRLLRENLSRYVKGEPLLNVVDKRAGY